MRKIPAHVREQQINTLPNITFVRWEGEYTGAFSKAVCRCDVDGFEWSARVCDLLNGGRGCPQCAGKRRWTADERIGQINTLSNITFIRWEGEYRDNRSKAVCRCDVDDYEWSASVDKLLNGGSGCPQCAGQRRWTAGERIEQINKLAGIRFVRWDGEYRNHKSKAVCRCTVAGHEWPTSVDKLLNGGHGCPACAGYGYKTDKPGTLYALRSECGTMVKIGISNDYERRHTTLKRKTPFEWSCIELLHGDGAMIAALEKALHGLTEPAVFKEPFDGYTEWRKWDHRILEWFSNWREMGQCR